MKTGSILDADMATMNALLRSGLRWWFAELAALLPQRWEGLIASRPAIVARYAAGDRFELFRQGVMLPASRRRREAPESAAVALAPHLCLVRPLSLPAMRPADARRMVLLDADRLLPFGREAAFLDVGMLGTEPGTGKMRVELAALPRDVADTVLASAERDGLDVRAMGIETKPGAPPRFDFLPAIRAERTTGDPGAARRFWWAVAAVALFLNVMAVIVRDMRGVAALEALVAAQSETATLARRLSQRVTSEDAARYVLMIRRERRNPLAVIAAVTRALPEQAWVQRLTWDGPTVRLAGYQSGNVDAMLALRRSRAFRNVRPSGSDISSTQAVGEPFDVTAEPVVAR